MAAMTGLLLLLWAGVTVGSVVDLQKRIIKGKTCGSKKGLYHVQLRVPYPVDDWVCGGSLIGPQWVLTAAHCWNQSLPMTAVVGVHPGKDQEELKVLNNLQFSDHDIMLLEIEKPKKKHPVVELPDCAKRPKVDKDKVQVAGHGPTTVGPNKEKLNDEPKKLQCGKMTVVNCGVLAQCAGRDSPFLKSKLNETWLCYKDKKGKVDTASGDSGGGVVFNNMIYGVHSGSHPEYACALPAVSMNVCYEKYLTWIYAFTDIIPRKKKSCRGCAKQ